jgi:hypothetical protein
MADNDRLISIDTTQEPGQQFPAEVQAEINALMQAGVEKASVPVVYFLGFGYKLTTTAPPLTGELRIDNADPLQATKLYVSRYGTGALGYNDLYTVLSRVDTNVECIVQGEISAARTVAYRILAPAKALPAPGAGTTYFEIDVQAVSTQAATFIEGLIQMTLHWV